MLCVDDCGQKATWNLQLCDVEDYIASHIHSGSASWSCCCAWAVKNLVSRGPSIIVAVLVAQLGTEQFSLPIACLCNALSTLLLPAQLDGSLACNLVNK